MTSTHKGFEYVWVRGSASAAFIAGTLIAGQVLVLGDLSAIVWMQAALLVGVAFGLRFVPGIHARLSQDAIEARSAWGGVRGLIRIAAFRRLLLVAALIYGSHSMQDGFAVIRWNAAGIGPTSVSVLWSGHAREEVCSQEEKAASREGGHKTSGGDASRNH